jgi:glucosylceramidase
MKLNFQLIGAYVFLAVTVSLFAQTAYLRTTTDANRWVDGGTVDAESWANTGNYVEISPETERQTVMGWGGTIQEKHWESMKILSEAGQDSIMRALFDTSGCNITYLRLPIGCCDFDLNEAPISLNETSGDYAMEHFSLERDHKRKIPLINMAQAINPNIRFWGCPWSPPRWMHDNGAFDRGNMKSDAQTLTAYALYLEKYVLGYKEADIDVEWVCCQNEPTIVDGGYPKCGWSNKLELDFYKNYLIPLFKKDNLSTRILLGVNCCGTYDTWIKYFMNDETVRSFVEWTSHSYQAPDWGRQSHTDYPDIPFMQTEAPFGWPPEDIAQNWNEGRDVFNNVSDFMDNYTSVYTVWSMVNDDRAESGFDWVQMVMIQVDRNTKKVTYNPYFWAYKHFAHYVKPGAKVVQVKANGGGPSKMNGFKNPNGDIVLVCANYNNNPYNLTVKVGDDMWKAQLPANSFNTLNIASGTTMARKNCFSSVTPVVNTKGTATVFDLRGKVVNVPSKRGESTLKNGFLPGTYIIRDHTGNTTKGKKVLTINGADSRDVSK